MIPRVLVIGWTVALTHPRIFWRKTTPVTSALLFGQEPVFSGIRVDFDIVIYVAVVMNIDDDFQIYHLYLLDEVLITYQI